ncbi:hypothetical protein [Mangrovibacterium lignilyticum]|uniref:hypothetical protein n=1 Tax=Mangrovibacterium lignilyticum TaxID=2668052 RepID=UPI0013D5F344|nr:hypothetical protein [Mangrovibacterium lignilyticum]
MKRREFLRQSARVGILTAMAGGVVLLASKNRIDWTCTENKTCKACTKYASCDLDQAIGNRKNEKG